jgi:hypothetical protein
MIRVNLDKFLPFFGHVGISINCLYRASRNTSATINADFGIDEKLGLAIAAVDTIDGTNIDARFVFGANTGLCDYVRHACEIVALVRRVLFVAGLDTKCIWVGGSR